MVRRLTPHPGHFRPFKKTTNESLKPDHRMLFVRCFHFGDLLWF